MKQTTAPPDTDRSNGHHAAQDTEQIALAIHDDLMSNEPTYTLDPAHAGECAQMLNRLYMTRKNNGLEAATRVAESIKARPNSPLAQLLARRAELAKYANVGTLMSDVDPEETYWLWPGRIALKKLHMLDGDPGLAKTLMMLDLIARLTTGRPMPGETWAAQPGGAVLISLEDGLGDTLQPRLARAGAALTKVLSMGYLEDDRMFSLETDLPALEAGIKRVNAKFVLMDPIMALLGGRDTYKDNEVRATLTPLKALAERCNVAIVMIRHVNKGGSEKLIYQGGGSIGFIGLARIGLMAVKNPDDEEQIILANVKNNLMKTAPKLLYRVVDDSPDDKRPYVKWEGVTTISDADLVKAPSKNTGNNRNAILALLKECKPVAMELHEIAEAMPEMSMGNLKMTLKRMYDQREIEKSSRGAYYAID